MNPEGTHSCGPRKVPNTFLSSEIVLKYQQSYRSSYLACVRWNWTNEIILRYINEIKIRPRTQLMDLPIDDAMDAIKWAKDQAINGEYRGDA
ncbi:hypothetical protein HAX54_036147 [Datura stramonium]|uniref:Uncharacterized protein n=1 Tax=Datura stramonium TaxID=4076 RepID=A0ABS8VK90_DATST|nr:hypothetical protein [Datura stramonium]